MAEASPTETSGSVGRIPRSRVLGLLIGLLAGAALLGLWWWTSIYLWSDLTLVTLGGLSLVAIGAAVPFRTRWIGAGLSVMIALAWVSIGLLLWAVREFAQHF